MKKVLKIVGIVILVLLVVIVLALAAIYIYHRIKLKEEEPLLEKPLGQMVEVDGHNMCVYSEGEGEHTLLFLSGSGTPAPILDFKSLYSLLDDDYRIVVIEKYGYGFSDIVDTERSFTTILRQDRVALEKAGIEGPFILCPHSMSGLEAIMWAQDYPDEVEAIVGLDMCTPHCMDVNKLKEADSGYTFLRGIARFMKATGIVRLFDYNESGALSDDDCAIYKEIACHKNVNDTMQNESNVENIIALNDDRNSAPLPTVPVMLYISNEPSNDEYWVGGMQAMVDASSDGTLIQLDCGHYVHNYAYERISQDMKAFIEKLNN